MHADDFAPVAPAETTTPGVAVDEVRAPVLPPPPVQASAPLPDLAAQDKAVSTPPVQNTVVTTEDSMKAGAPPTAPTPRPKEPLTQEQFKEIVKTLDLREPIQMTMMDGTIKVITVDRLLMFDKDGEDTENIADAILIFFVSDGKVVENVGSAVSITQVNVAPAPRER